MYGSDYAASGIVLEDPYMCEADQAGQGVQGVVAWDRDQAGLAKLKSELLAEDASIEVEEYVVDISDIEQVRQAAAQVEEDLEPIDCVVNNARVVNKAPLTKLLSVMCLF